MSDTATRRCLYAEMLQGKSLTLTIDTVEDAQAVLYCQAGERQAWDVVFTKKDKEGRQLFHEKGQGGAAVVSANPATGQVRQGAHAAPAVRQGLRGRPVAESRGRKGNDLPGTVETCGNWGGNSD